jgi:hypothetical protein
VDAGIAFSINVLARSIEDRKTPVVGKGATGKNSNRINRNAVERLNGIDEDARKVRHKQVTVLQGNRQQSDAYCTTNPARGHQEAHTYFVAGASGSESRPAYDLIAFKSTFFRISCELMGLLIMELTVWQLQVRFFMAKNKALESIPPEVIV